MNNPDLNALIVVSLFLLFFTSVIVRFMRRDQSLCDIGNHTLYAFSVNALASVLIISMLVISIIGKSNTDIIISVISLTSSIGSLLSITVAYTTEAYQGSFHRWTNNHFLFSLLSGISLFFLLLINLF